MSGRTPYMTDIWKAGVEVGRPTLIGVRRQPRCRRSLARNGAVRSASARSSTERERPSIWPFNPERGVPPGARRGGSGRRGRPAEVESPHESVEQALEAQGEVVEWHPELYCSVAQAREERGWCSIGSP